MEKAGLGLDHLLIGAASLDDGIGWLEERTGVRAARGGSHPGLGTWNALASLGDDQYVEIIAPDPAQDGVATFYVPDLRLFPEPRLATWAAKGKDLVRLASVLRPPLSCGPAREGSRLRPDGQTLEWSLAFPRHEAQEDFGGLLPFLIEWKSPQAHPGRSTPPGLALISVALEHPQSYELSAALAALGIDVEVAAGPSPRLSAVVSSPRGRVTL